MGSMPRKLEHELYLLLREERVRDFNELWKSGERVDFTGCDFRGVDLRGLQAEGACFKDAYFRGADLRGLDLRSVSLEGASLAQALVSGTYFPAQLPAQEIQMSVQLGTRMRYSS